jgi:16S rRNA C967 or C1407 C5-methylase (RsmB/RsmF family)
MQQEDASDGSDEESTETASPNADNTAAFTAYYKHQAISDDASALFAKRLPIAVRVNRSSPCAALCTATLTMRPAPVAGTFFVDAASELLAAFQEVGALARQELVSCVPPALLDAKRGDVVADLCAAPGMKALQLLDAVGGDGLVVASEVDRKRLAVLVRRGRRSTAKGAFLALCADARRFPGCDLCGNQILGAPRHRRYDNLTHCDFHEGMRRRTGWKQKYDKVLCDVPCSGLCGNDCRGAPFSMLDGVEFSGHDATLSP